MNQFEKNFLTPLEIIEKYPALRYKLNWNASELGLFLKCKLIVGYYDRSKRVAMINEQSVIELIEHTNKTIEQQKLAL